MGYRLPLDSLPWVAPDDRDVSRADPFAPTPIRPAAASRAHAAAPAGAGGA